MRKFRAVALCVAFSTGSPVIAQKAPCPRHEIGVLPWEAGGVMPGDLWALVYLDIDKGGHPLRCYIGETNIYGSETRSNICRSFLSGWRATPPASVGAHGVTTIKRKFVLAGTRHDKLLEEARKRFFAEHPDERPDCWND